MLKKVLPLIGCVFWTTTALSSDKISLPIPPWQYEAACKLTCQSLSFSPAINQTLTQLQEQNQALIHFHPWDSQQESTEVGYFTGQTNLYLPSNQLARIDKQSLIKQKRVICNFEGDNFINYSIPDPQPTPLNRTHTGYLVFHQHLIKMIKNNQINLSQHPKANHVSILNETIILDIHPAPNNYRYEEENELHEVINKIHTELIPSRPSELLKIEWVNINAHDMLQKKYETQLH